MNSPLCEKSGSVSYCVNYTIKNTWKMRKIKQTVRTILLCGFLFAYTDATLAQITLSVKQQPVREVIKEIERIEVIIVSFIMKTRFRWRNGLR